MNNRNTRDDRQQRRALLVVLSVCVASVYMLTYSARIEATDTLFMFDATASLVQFGDFRQDLTHGERPFWAYETLPPGALPLLPVDAEPLQMVLAAPLLALANLMPGVGRVHTVWLFNVFVTTAGVALFYAYALQLGYRAVVSFAGALLFALGTIVWPYSKTFFQEPLTLLLVLLAAYTLDRWRTSRDWRVLFAAALCVGTMLLARRGAALALPALGLVAFPWTARLFRSAGARYAFLTVVIFLGVLLYINTAHHSAEHLTDLYRDKVFMETVPWEARKVRAALNQALRGYLFSVGGSVWGTSPVVLLAVPGMLWLGVRNRMRYPVAALTLLLTYALGYAYGANYDWFGGLSWPPRFLVPVVPFLMLCALPAVAYLLDGVRDWWWRLAWAGAVPLVAYSLWVQFNGVAYWWGEYTRLLPAAAGGFTEWSGGLNNVRYLRWVLLPDLWGTVPLDFAWVRAGAPGVALVFALLALVSLAAARWVVRGGWDWRLVGVLPALWGGALGWTLTRIYDDTLYLAFSDGLWDVLPLIEAETRPDEVLLIGSLGHERFFLNYGPVPNRVVSLPDHPGEQPSPDQPPEVVSANPAALLARPTLQLVETLAARQDRLWVLNDGSLFIPWAVLPLEQTLSAQYYPLAAYETTGDDGLPVLLTSYYVGARHDPLVLRGPDVPTDLRFGDHIRLRGVTLPAGTAYAPGDVLPVSLQWTTDAPLATRYSVALHLAQPGLGVAASARDSAPSGGFAPTSDWTPGAPVWDNRGIALPDVLAPGEYALWVAVYAGAPLPVTGAATAENGTLGVLPMPITIQEP